jgi:hypothetical protein
LFCLAGFAHVQSALLALGNELSATLGRLLGYIGVLAVVAALAAKLLGMPGDQAAGDAAQRPQWLAIDRPHRAFALLLPEFPNEPEPNYAILRHVSGGGRKDVMIWGEPDAPGSRLMIEIYRPGSELDPGSSTTDSTEELGTAATVKPAGSIDSKFGVLTLVEFAAHRADRTRRCLGFARAFDEPRLRIAGWYCRGSDELVEPHLIVCALDRLTVIAAGNDPRVSALFAQADLQRRFCQPKTATPGASIRRNDWLAAARNPKLRGRHAIR